MKDISIAIMLIIAIAMLTIVLLSETKNNYNKEIELKELTKQRDELKTKNEEKRKRIIPVNIDCEKDIKEGDIKVNVQMEVYNPLGEWIEITEDNVEYQLNYGSRIVNCE